MRPLLSTPFRLGLSLLGTPEPRLCLSEMGKDEPGVCNIPSSQPGQSCRGGQSPNGSMTGPLELLLPPPDSRQTSPPCASRRAQRRSFSAQFSLSVMSDSATPWTAARQASLSITNSRSLLKLMSIESVMPSSHLILCRPDLLPPSIFPSIRVFSKESVHIMRPKDWSFSFSISPSNEYLGLISFRRDWLSLLAVQGTLKSLFQHHRSKASILWCSTFFIVQLSHPYMTTGKTIALSRRTFVDKVISLLLNMLSRLVITFLPRSKHLLISWLQAPSATNN